MAARPHDALNRTPPTFVELFTPKLVTTLREGYSWTNFQADAVAGLTVAIVALPLSMAIAIGSGLPPEKGLYAAIVGGFLVSALGGSRFQIGGPAGAFIVLVATIVERHGYDGLVLATMMAGLIMVGVGFTAGIATIIFASQVKELLGLQLAKEPAALVPKIAALGSAIATANPVTIAVSVAAVALIVGVRRVRPKWPGLLIAVSVTAMLAWLFQLDVATIGSRFGEVPRTLPAPALPAFDLSKLQAALPDAISIALLGAIESLLSAVVADSMSGRRHRSNCELVAQGFANIAAVCFGGMCVTGTIARTATNVRAGAHGPVAGMLHALYVLLFMLVAAPLVAFIPLASLGAVLAVVAWNMAEKAAFWRLLRSSWGDAAVLLSTFLLTIFADLSTAIATGVVLGAFQFLHRMAEAVAVETGQRIAEDDEADAGVLDRPTNVANGLDSDIVVFRISGAFFFGAASAVTSVLERIGARPKAFVLDFSSVPLIDSTAAQALEGLAQKLQRSGIKIYFAGASKPVRRALLQAGLRKPLVYYSSTTEAAMASWRTVAVADDTLA